MSSYKKIIHGEHAYYVSEHVFEHTYKNDPFAFTSNGPRRMTEMSDFVVHRPTQKVLKSRFDGEMMFDRLLGIEERTISLMQKFAPGEV